MLLGHACRYENVDGVLNQLAASVVVVSSEAEGDKAMAHLTREKAALAPGGKYGKSHMHMHWWRWD